MAQEYEQHGAELTYGHDGPRALPSILTAPAAVKAWRMRAIIVAVVFGLLSLVFVFTPEGRNHLLRAYLMGVMTCFNFTGGALAFLLVQYVSGGKWGQVLRRPLEAMTRTIWIVVLMMLPVLFLMKHLYQWAMFTTPAETLKGFHAGLLTQEQQLCINLKHAMLNPVSVWVQAIIVLGFMAIVITLLSKWSVTRDADPAAGSFLSFDRWRTVFENLSGPSLLLYVILM